jgi:hypothetical protein
MKAREFERAVTQKGFTVIDRDHRYYFLNDAEGKKTPVRTKVSHDQRHDISDNLLSIMYKQLHFKNKAEFMKFIDCTITYETYLNDLMTRGII